MTEKRMVQCNGPGRHHYNADEHSQCPYCGINIDLGDTLGIADAAPPSPHPRPDADVGLKGHTASMGQKATKPAPVDAPTVREGLIRREDRTIHPVVGWLVCIEGPDQGRDFRIRSERNHIGRAAEMDIAIAGDDRISRQSHAVISYNPKKHRFSIAPGSGNGLTYLNENEVLTAETLNAYDMIELGVSKLLFIPFCGTRFSWQDGLTQATPAAASSS